MASDLDKHIARLKARNFSWPIPWLCVEDRARRENCILVSYLCPAKVWSIGWGETDGVGPGMTWTEDEADMRFFMEIRKYAAAVFKMCTLKPNLNQLGAMTQLAYNIGLRRDKPTKGGLYHTTVLRLHNAGDFDGAARAFYLLNQARDRQTGKYSILPGLVAARAAEAAIYLTPVDGSPVTQTPQEVAHESSLINSPISRSGGTVAAAGTVAGAVSMADQIQSSNVVLDSVKTGLTSIKSLVASVSDLTGIPPGTMLALVLIVAGVLIMRYRDRQRKEGWS